MADDYTGEEKSQTPRTLVTEMSYKKFGGTTGVRVSQVTAGTTATELVKPNPNRVALLLINNSAAIVYLSFIPEVSDSYGVPIGANGGSMKMAFDDYGEALCGPIHAIAGSDSLGLTLIEVLIQGV